MNSAKKLKLSPSKKQFLAQRDRYVEINMLLHETFTSANTNNEMIALLQNKEEKQDSAPA